MRWPFGHNVEARHAPLEAVSLVLRSASLSKRRTKQPLRWRVPGLESLPLAKRAANGRTGHRSGSAMREPARCNLRCHSAEEQHDRVATS